MIESAVTDLPLPDSPTRPSVSPARISKLTSCDRRRPGRADGRSNTVVRWSTSRSRIGRCRITRARRPWYSPNTRAHRVGDLADAWRCASTAAMIGGTRLLRPRAAALDSLERGAPRRRAPARADGAHARDLLAARRPGSMRNDVASTAVATAVVREAVDADDDRVAGVDRLLRAIGGLLDLALDEARSRSPRACRRARRCDRAAPSRSRSIAFVSASIAYDAADRIDRVRDAGLGGDDLLRAQRDARRFLGRQRQRLVAAVAVQRLRAAEHRRQRLQRDADDVVVGLLRGQRAAGGLRVEAQLLRARIRRAEPVAHDARPQPPRRAELRDLLEKVVVRVEEEREALPERVDVEPGVDRRPARRRSRSRSVNATSWTAVEPASRM